MATSQITHPTITLRLCPAEFVAYVQAHSGHLTTDAAVRIAGDLAEASSPWPNLPVITCYRHGDTCTASYDHGDGWYYITTDSYTDHAAAWADTIPVSAS